MKYIKELEAAILRSRKLGVSVKDFHASSNRYYSAERMTALFKSIRQWYGSITMHDLARKCAEIGYNFMPEIKAVFHEDALFTLGYYRECKSKKMHCYFTEEDIYSWLKDGVDNPNGWNVHAWITLPSLEILDLTILAKEGDYDPQIIVLAKHISDISNVIIYHPMLVGEEFITRFRAYSKTSYRGPTE